MHEKRTLLEGIVVHLDPRNVANHLKDNSAEHAEEEPPGAVTDAEEELAGKRDTKETGIQRISDEFGHILRIGKRQGASGEGAEFARIGEDRRGQIFV